MVFNYMKYGFETIPHYLVVFPFTSCLNLLVHRKNRLKYIDPPGGISPANIPELRFFR